MGKIVTFWQIPRAVKQRDTELEREKYRVWTDQSEATDQVTWFVRLGQSEDSVYLDQLQEVYIALH